MPRKACQDSLDQFECAEADDLIEALRGSSGCSATCCTIGDYVGHSSTFMVDRYRHLLEGNEQEAARLFDDYLARSGTAARVEQLDS